jgi:AraC-like DNA-binding protein
LHGDRNELRLRCALERLERDDCDLTRLALDLGYSSHSHFTSSFRVLFGVPPSAIRRIARARS